MSATLPPRATGTREDWSGRRERSNKLALRLMAWVAVTLGRPVARWLLHPIALYYLCFAPTARRNSARYLRRVLGRAPRFRDRYRHLHAFAATVLDRVYFVRGELQAFELQIGGEDVVREAIAEGRGAFLLGAHIGSFEALHALGENQPALRVAMVMYPDNARMIHGVLQALAPDFKLGIIAIGRPGSTLAIREWLDDGGLVGLLGDRHLAAESVRGAGGARVVELPFLGVPARFTDGPLRLALLLRRRVLFMVGLYDGGKRYTVRFETLVDFRAPMADGADAAEREARIQAALQDYVARLEALVREAPFNWFNFYDFWCEDSAH